jgi:aryl-alcohol dehydrogenase
VSEIIQAAIAEEAGKPFAVRDVELGDVRADEVLVRVHACGVCHTDLAARDQQLPAPLPIVLGHEGAGTVDEVGSEVTKVRPGDRVLLTFGSCGTCANCAVGMSMHCYTGPDYNFLGSRLDGTTSLSYEGKPIHSHFIAQSSFATKAVVCENSVMKIDDDVPFEVIAPFGCCVITGAGTVLNALKAEAGSSIAIFGVGGVGMSALLAARAAGCAEIAVVDLHRSRLELAKELGATHVVDASDGHVVERIRAITGHGVNYAVDCSGSPGILGQALDVTAPLGTTAAVGSPPMGSEVHVDIIQLIMTGKKLIGVADGWSVPQILVPRLVELWRQGRFPVNAILRTFAFEAINDAVSASASGEVIKPVLSMV